MGSSLCSSHTIFYKFEMWLIFEHSLRGKYGYYSLLVTLREYVKIVGL